ncbi:MAG: hypothetical protein RLZZ480_840, partial [Candidatus Parcubacteria bacterium]
WLTDPLRRRRLPARPRFRGRLPNVVTDTRRLAEEERYQERTCTEGNEE